MKLYYFSSKKKYNRGMKSKKDLRTEIKKLFTQQESDFLDIQNKEVQKLVIQYLQDNNIKTLCCYEHIHNELKTDLVIEYARQNNIKVYTPQMISETEMILIDDEYEIYDDTIDLFIIPGRAFSSLWKRLGRGKGYYDRFLVQKKYKKSKKIWIGYSFQIFPEIPTSSYDIDMDTIIYLK